MGVFYSQSVSFTGLLTLAHKSQSLVQSYLSKRPQAMYTSAKATVSRSVVPTKVKGAHGPIESNIYPPMSANIVVPTEPKKKASPLRVPRMCGFMFRMKSTSTLMNCTTLTTMVRMQRM